MNKKALIFICLLTAFMPASAISSTPTPVQKTCPVGGKFFTYIATNSLSTWGKRPDGKPYTSWIAPMPMAVCPDNGLVIYKDFSKEEIALLEKLIRTPEYISLRSEVPRYRAAWLLKKLDSSKILSRLWLLNEASWESDGDAKRKARYQREFAEGVAALPPQVDDSVWLNLQIYAANAWRELGDLSRAQAILGALPLAALEVAPGPNATKEELAAAQAKQSVAARANSISEVIKRGDTSSEPLSLIPTRIAAQKCRDLEIRSPASVEGFCKSVDMQTRIEMMRQN